jgi:two-component system, cell cycle sensor histidine kinase and response regulator CckA
MSNAPVVLVVDDDPEVRRALTQGLTNDGMTAIDAASGQEALRILAADPTIGVLLTDIMMPGIAGTTLAERAARLRPDLKILMVTAYAPALPAPPSARVLEKPFRIAELCAAVRAL